MRYNFKKLALAVMLGFLVAGVPAVAVAGDVYVNGYTRSDGTYVRAHIRSSPDSSTSNNYGRSKNDYELLNPRSRDEDGDGIPNYLDSDNGTKRKCRFC